MALYKPRGEPDALGRFVLRGLAANADQIYWARMQRSPTHYRDSRGGVLLIGDAASGFFPSLGQVGHTALHICPGSSPTHTHSCIPTSHL